MRSINICPIRVILQEMHDPNIDFIICSTERLIDGSTPPNVLCLQFADTVDEKHPLAFSIEQAKIVVDFFRRNGRNKDMFVCCDAGESRSAAIAAALLLADNQSDEDIWWSTEYHPNTLVFGIMCRALDIQMESVDIEQRKVASQRAIHEEIFKNRGRNK